MMFSSLNLKQWSKALMQIAGWMIERAGLAVQTMNKLTKDPVLRTSFLGYSFILPVDQGITMFS
jgi:hypothetical protein